MKSGNWVPISKALIPELPNDRPYTRLEAMFSLAVDYDQEKQVTIKGYAGLWQWSQGKVQRFLSDIGASIEYPENTGKKQNQRGEIVIQISERKRRDNGEIKLIDSKCLEGTPDRKQREDGEKAERSQVTTKDPNPNPIKTTCPKPQKTVSPDALRLSEILAEMILENNPQNRSVNNGKRRESVSKWATDIEKIIRIDNQQPGTIERVIRWSQSDSFWKVNILSGSKLREKWDQISAKAIPVNITQPATTLPESAVLSDAHKKAMEAYENGKP
jgi:hypothetical protein